MDVITLLGSEASLVSLAGNGEDSQKTGYLSDACNSCSSFGGFAEAVDSESIEGARR